MGGWAHFSILPLLRITNFSTSLNIKSALADATLLTEILFSHSICQLFTSCLPAAGPAMNGGPTVDPPFMAGSPQAVQATEATK